jgi:hypothetical protein
MTNLFERGASRYAEGVKSFSPLRGQSRAAASKSSFSKGSSACSDGRSCWTDAMRTEARRFMPTIIA